jgi:uncharacterized protein YfaS (alpha-2-macroglobulin family)
VATPFAPTATAVPTAPQATFGDSFTVESFPPLDPIIIHFDQVMDPESTAKPLHTMPPIDGSVSWNDDFTSITLIPDSPFEPGETIRIAVSQELTSRAGIPLPETKFWLLHIQEVPQIWRRNPQRELISERQPEIDLIFNTTMDEASVAAALSVEPDHPFSLDWKGKTLTLTPGEPFAYDTRYEFTLAETAIAADGSKPVQAQHWSYKLEDLKARLDAPSDEQRDAPYMVRFNYPMNPETVQAALALDPETPFNLEWSNDKKTAAMSFDQPLIPGTTYSLTFNAPMSDTFGDPLPAPDHLSFRSPPAILAATPVGQNVHPFTKISITFDRPMDEDATMAAFQISPTVEGDLSWEETTLTFTPGDEGLAEWADYRVTVDTTAIDDAGETILDEPYTFSFATGYPDPLVSFGYGPNAQVLDANGRRAVQFERYDEDPSLTFELYRLTQEQFLDKYSSGFRGTAGWELKPISTSDAELVAEWEYTPPQQIDVNIHTNETIIPVDVPPGLYILNAHAGFLNSQLILVISENNLAVKQAEGQIVAWVTEINGDPRPGAMVSVYARDGELVSQGVADENGLFRTQIQDRDVQPLIVLAQVGEDQTASGLSTEWRTGGSFYGWWRPAPQTLNFSTAIYTDRPIYRPGQTVFFKAIIRDDDDAILTNPPQGTPITVRLRDPRDNVVQTRELTTNSFGTINGSFDIAAGAMLGEWHVEVEMDGESRRQLFKVEDYRKPDYQVILNSSGDSFIQGETVNITLESSYFFAEPVANASIESDLFVLRPEYGFSFAGETYHPSDMAWYLQRTNVARGNTDENGRFSLNLPLDMKEFGQQVNWHSNQKEAILALEATVNDGSNQPVSGFTTFKVYDRAERIDLDLGGYLQKPGEPFNIKASVHDIFENPVDGRALELTLRRWDRSSYAYDNIVQSTSITTGADGHAFIDFTIDEPGHYQLRATGTDQSGNEISYITYVYAFSRNYSTWYGQSDALKIEADRESYAPGETAQLIIQSDFSGPALLTFERGTTRREELVQLDAPVTVIEVSILPHDAPNIFVTINAWQELDTTLDESTFTSLSDSRLHTANVELSVPVTDKTLFVTITPDKETYLPREEATFTLRVTNREGIPVSAEVSLAMVDEAIFALSEDLSKPLLDSFYYKRRNAVRTYDAMALERWLGGGRGGGGGGDDYGAAPRSDFPDTAEWFPTLHTDYNGEAAVSLAMPDNLTSWRLTAKAVTADTQVGEAITNVITHQDIQLRPILPRTLTTGDEVNLSVLLHNYSDTAQTIDVELLVDDAQMTVHDPLLQKISINPGDVKIIGWPLTSTAAGQVEILVQASIGSEVQDAIQMPLTVRPLAVPDFNTETGQFQGEKVTTFILPRDTLPQSGVHIELSRTIAGSLLEGLEYLTGFPYGCVEQTMSRALPNAVVARAFYQLGVSNPTIQADLPAKINASVQRLYAYQHNDGGWGWWYDDSSHDYQTAWVIFGLATIADAGYEIDPAVIERGVGWLNDNLANMDPRTRAYALYSMAVAGHPNGDATLAMLDDVPDLDTFSRAALALALLELDERQTAQEIVDLLEETAVTTDNGRVFWQGDAQDGHYYRKTMASDIRSSALALSALVQINPNHHLEPGVVQWLMDQRKRQGWGTTNETAYTILSLTDHLLSTTFGAGTTPTTYTIYLNGDNIVQGKFAQGEPAFTLDIPASELQTGTNELRITQNGADHLFYALNSRLYLAEKEIDPAGNVQIVRRYLDPETGRPVKSVEPGTLVEVELEINLPADGSYILVEDNLPGGLEALNERLNTTSHRGADEFTETVSFSHEYGYNHKEVHGDRVTFFITELAAGDHKFNYLTRAAHSGEFVAMPAEAYAMYDLSTWGRSASSILSILPES